MTVSFAAERLYLTQVERLWFGGHCSLIPLTAGQSWARGMQSCSLLRFCGCCAALLWKTNKQKTPWEHKQQKLVLSGLLCSDVPLVTPSHGWVFSEGITTARDLEPCPLLSAKLGKRLGLRGLHVDESESCESCTVTQLMTLARWFALQQRENNESCYNIDKQFIGQALSGIWLSLVFLNLVSIKSRAVLSEWSHVKQCDKVHTILLILNHSRSIRSILRKLCVFLIMLMDGI